MPDMKSLENIELVIFFLVPGAVILFVRSQLSTGRLPPIAEATLSYFILSLIYVAMAYAPLRAAIAAAPNGFVRTLLWLGFAVLLPAAFGLLLGLAVQRDWFYRLAHRVGIQPVHAAPTAWDWIFQRATPKWVVVVLKDGTIFRGWMGRDAFMSSQPDERDLYISRIYEAGEDGVWKPMGNTGLYVAHGEIRTIEFIEPEEDDKP